MSLGEPAGEFAPLFLALAESVSDGVALCRAGRLRWANSRLCALLGVREPRELVGREMDSLIEDAGSGLPEPAASVECRVVGPGREADRRYVRVLRAAAHAAGSGTGDDWEMWVLEEMGTQRRLEREIYRAGRALHDVNRELERCRDRLDAQTGEREELLTVVSHELRTPLTVVRGYNNLLLSGEVGTLNEEQRRFLAESNKSCERLNAFIANLLDASSEMAAGHGLRLVEGELAPVVRGVASFLRPLLEERRLRLELALSEGVPVEFDEMRIEQVITNLLANAIRYTKEGGIVAVECAEIETAAGGFVEVAVEDEGPGVADAVRDRIFEPYVRSSDGGRAAGLGLGLAICKRIVDAHGGSIHVRDREGGGSRFAFALPVRREKS